MPTGTVKFFNEAKGYGFIVEDDTNRDIFVHVTGLGGLTIRENDQVEYEVVEVTVVAAVCPLPRHGSGR